MSANCDYVDIPPWPPGFERSAAQRHALRPGDSKPWRCGFSSSTARFERFLPFKWRKRRAHNLYHSFAGYRRDLEDRHKDMTLIHNLDGLPAFHLLVRWLRLRQLMRWLLRIRPVNRALPGSGVRYRCRDLETLGSAHRIS